MKAVIIATGDCSGMKALNERYPAPLLPLVDRPFIQHVVEFLIDQGVTEFDFILSHLPEQIEDLLGDGTRWGSTFRFHLVRDPSRAYTLLKTVTLNIQNEPILLGQGDRLPYMQLEDTQPSQEATAPVLFCWRDPSDCAQDEHVEDSPQNTRKPRKWTGWAWLSPQHIADLPNDADTHHPLDEPAIGSHLMSIARLVEVPEPLCVRSYDELLSSHRRVLAKEFPGLMLSGRETDEGLWVSRNVSLHPMARLIPPVYIGQNCRIGMGVQLGPNAVLGSDCVLNARCTVSNSVIFQGSYVGEALELADVIVDRNRLINVRVGGAMSLADDFILGSLSDKPIRRCVAGLLSRATASVLLVLTSPVLLVTVLWLKSVRRGPVVHKTDVVRLPASSDEAQWRTFSLWSFGSGGGLRHLFLRFLPALIHIVKGELRFVGVRPRTKEEIKALPQDWKALYLRSKAGIVTEALIHYGVSPTEDELYSAEAFHSVTTGIRHDLKLLIGYAGRLLWPRRKSERAT